MNPDPRHVQFELNDPEAFHRRVKVPRATAGAVGALLALSLAALAYNLLSTLRTDGAFRNWRPFWMILPSTRGEDSADSVLFTVLVWAPLVMIPLCLILLGWMALTRRSAVAKVHAQFVERGYVANQASLNAMIQPNKKQKALELVALSHPSLAPGGFEALVRDASQAIAMGDGVALGGINVTESTLGLPLSRLFPPAPPQVQFSTRRASPMVVVIPVENPQGTGARVLEMREK